MSNRETITIEVPADPHPPATNHPARRIACPKCGAPAGQSCHASTEWPHPARIKAVARMLVREAWESDAAKGGL